VGERAEVLFDDQWFIGDVLSKDADGTAKVHCDVDPANVFVSAHVSVLRRPQPLPARGGSKDDLSLDTSASSETTSKAGKRLAGHRRTHSV